VLRNIWKNTCVILIKYRRQFIIIEQRQHQIDLKTIIYDMQYQCIRWILLSCSLNIKNHIIE